jgi:hypothetical protein
MSTQFIVTERAATATEEYTEERTFLNPERERDRERERWMERERIGERVRERRDR